MIFDTHMHCDYSCDSEMKFADAIGAAAEQGIGITVTEHWDYDYPTNPEAFIFDIDEYFARLQPLSSDKVLIGIEIGMQTHTADEDKKVAQAHPFDYVLASIHCIGGRDLYEQTCYKGRTRQQIVEEFLHDAITCLEQERLRILTISAVIGRIRERSVSCACRMHRNYSISCFYF